jgi:Flp pilus assembly pilin Flp
MGSLRRLNNRLFGMSVAVICAIQADRRAVTAIEYALIAGVIVTAIVGSLLSGLAPNLTNTFNAVSSKL